MSHYLSNSNPPVYYYQPYTMLKKITGKRKLGRRTLPYLENLYEKLPYSKLPTNLVVLKRLYYENEMNLPDANITVKNELKALWEYAGYGDILIEDGDIVKKIKVSIECFFSLGDKSD